MKNFTFIPGMFDEKTEPPAFINYTDIYSDFNETELDYNNSVINIDHNSEYDSF